MVKKEITYRIPSSQSMRPIFLISMFLEIQKKQETGVSYSSDDNTYKSLQYATKQ